MKEAYAHCVACDTKFYPVWRARLGEFESLCDRCRQTATWAAKVDVDLFRDQDNWSSTKDMPTAEQDRMFIDGLIQDFNAVDSNILSEDEYHEYGEGAFGSLNYFDR